MKKKMFKLSMSTLDGCDDARRFYLNMISVTVPNWKRGHDKIHVTTGDEKVKMVRASARYIYIMDDSSCYSMLQVYVY